MLNKALAIIQDEHRSLAAVIHGLRYLVREISRESMAPDFTLLTAMVHYIGAYTGKLHHPKEEQYVFARLRLRTGQAEEVIATLERQHKEGGDDFSRLTTALDAYQSGEAGGLEAFAVAVETLADNAWKHMGIEENLLIPMAKQYLTGADWVEIADAFGDNGDPRFSVERDHEFRDLFSRIVNLAPPPIGIGPSVTK